MRLSEVFTIATLALGLGILTQPAFADATVTVELRSKAGAAVDGVVTLTKGDVHHSCATAKGHCDIKGVAGGLYTVEAKLEGKPSPKPKQVMIPPAGEVRLIVSVE